MPGGSVNVSGGLVTIRKVTLVIKNTGDHTDCIHVTLDVMPPGGLGNPEAAHQLAASRTTSPDFRLHRLGDVLGKECQWYSERHRSHDRGALHRADRERALYALKPETPRANSVACVA